LVFGVLDKLYWVKFIFLIFFNETEWYFTRAFCRHLTRPILIPYVAVVIFLVKRNEIAFIVISELATGFVPSGPKLCSRPFYCPWAAVENFVTFTSRCCVFEGKNSNFFAVLLLDVIYNVTAWISN
jgi:hypothetical protein